MISLDKDALICDLAETYGIYDMDALPVRTLAALASGLRENARIRLKAAGQKVSFDTCILAALFDRVGNLIYMLSDKSTDPPKSVLDALIGSEPESQCRKFESGEDFEAERQRIIKRAGGTG